MTRTGKDYLANLDDGRDVQLEGKRVSSVADHPSLRETCGVIAELYDRQCDADATDILTVDIDCDTRVARSFLPPHTAADLVSRRAAFKMAADVSHGLVGRSPDFIATAVTAFAAASDYFATVRPDFGENIVRLWERARDKDLFLAHATINPSTNRHVGSATGGNQTTHLRVTDRNSHGITVSGAKLISTLAPIADELVVFPLPGYRPGDEAFTAAFSVPIATPGLRLVCRDTFGSTGRSAQDHPLGRFDEIDATCIFDNVAVPWDRVFFLGDVEKANRLYDATTARHHTGHHGIVRGLAKAELLVGIAIALAESAGTNQFLQVQEMLGELIGALELTRGAVLQAEAGAVMSALGTMTPAIPAIQALRYHFPRMCARMIEVIQIIGAGSLLAAPTFADLAAVGGEELEHMFQPADGGTGRDRLALLKLAWDATGDALGQRQMQYERYHSGDPVRLAAQQYLAYDTRDLLDSLERSLPRVDR
jgi:4-hydroxyphenylacetate 3-monooxygenase oxygenase component